MASSGMLFVLNLMKISHLVEQTHGHDTISLCFVMPIRSGMKV
jgi:hypothetical protein